MNPRFRQRSRLGVLNPVVAAALLAAIAYLFVGSALTSGLDEAAAAPATPARLTIEAGDAGVFIPGRPLPVRVRVNSDVLIAGQLVVSTGFSQLAMPVQIAGGSSQQFELVLPSGQGQNQVQVQVALSEHKTRLVTVSAIVNPAPDTEVVGLVPDLITGQPVPGPAPLSIDVGTTRFIALSEQDLALAPGSLGPLTAVALGPESLGRLSGSVRQALLTWTAGGGRLLIDAKADQSITGLPAAWRPVGALSVTAGRGQVTMTGGSMAAGRWAGLVAPASHAANTPALAGFESQGFTLSNAMATEAGLTTPKLPWLIVFIVVYIVVVGPVSFILLRRLRRAELLWIVIPVVAALFAGTSYAVGSSQRAGVNTVHGTVIDTTLPGGAALSYVGIFAGGESTARLSVPTGWTVDRYADASTFSGPGPVPINGTIVDTGIEGQLNLNVGQFAIVRTGGPAGFTGQLMVSASSSTDGEAEGTVTNATAFTLHDVSILIGTSGTDIGGLASGATAKWKISGPTRGTSGFLEQQLWGSRSLGEGSPGVIIGGAGPFGPQARLVRPGLSPTPVTGLFDANSPASLPVWEAGPGGLAPGTRSTGVAVAVGWTGEYKPQVTIEGHGPPAKGPTAIVGTAAVQPGASVGDLAIDRRVVRGDLVSSQIGPGMFVTGPVGSTPAVVAWTIPPGGSRRAASLSIPAGAGDTFVWSGQAWRSLAKGTIVPQAVPPGVFTPPTTTADSGPAGGGSTTTLSPKFAVPAIPIGPFGTTGPPTEVTLKDGDVHDGVVYVRIDPAVQGRPFDLGALTLKVLT